VRLVHLADLHLGFRQYDRVDAAGINRREADVNATFHHLIDRVIELAPDVVVVAGDVFHVVRPSNAAILNAHTEFSRLVSALPDTVIVLVAGNHDLPRSTESAGLLPLFAPLGIHVVDWAAQRLQFPALELSILAVPDAPGMARPVLAPDPAARFNVLLLHGEVQGMLADGKHAGDRAAVEISAEELRAPEWDYVALGHYHVYREIQPNCFYAGSIDYTSSDPWGEMREEDRAGLTGKGFAERDLVTGNQTFHPLPTSRRLVDLPAFSAAGMTTERLDQALRAALDRCPGGVDEKIVRLAVHDVPRDIARALDQKMIRSYKSRALNLGLTFRRPEEMTRMRAVRGARRKALDLHELVAQHIREHLPDDLGAAGITVDELLAGAQRYLDATKPAGDDDTSLAQLLEASLEQSDLALGENATTGVAA
jgi:exonuclease SbcD